MQIRAGCTFTYHATAPIPAAVLVSPHPEPPHRVVDEVWQVTPTVDRHGYRDGFGNRIERLILPTGISTLRYDALVEVSGEQDPADPEATEARVEDLPDNLLVYTLSSRYCVTEPLSQVAWHLFGNVAPGYGRVQAICDWLHANIQYGRITSTPATTAVDVYVAGGGMCRDFAHLAITFCRCLNIPARYVFGYMPEFRPPEESTPMDFHAWFEAWLGGRWYTFDARFNRPLAGRIPIGIGRDAVDVAMVTTWGPAAFRGMTVWADIVGEGEAASAGAATIAPPCTEALFLGADRHNGEGES